ncbi:hypothetical protein OB919_04690 [Halobacteria archaeon AArc-curdl1]|uniref:Uncharacterized protein n=1 Tax=Natronosalvus hydrolyticus TaxID=2979988 RepID=A0AAP3E5E1_9EURY|nr:hypothetical protein [Halobacteria archaeon AArc-curdl1]
MTDPAHDGGQSNGDESDDDIEPGTGVADSLYPLLFRGLEAVIGLGDGETFADDESKQALEDVYTDSVAPDERKAFEDALGTETNPDLVRSVLETVQSALEAKKATITLDHRTVLSLPTREACLYSVLTNPTRDTATGVEELVTDRVRAAIERGLEDALDSEYESAAAHFEAAREATVGMPTSDPDVDDAVVSRVLAAWAHFHRGESDRALERVAGALQYDEDAWSPRIIGVAANHPESQGFLEGRLGVRLCVRHTIEQPSGSTVDEAFGCVRTEDGTLGLDERRDSSLESDENAEDRQTPPLHGRDDVDWLNLENPSVLSEVTSDTIVRLRLQGNATGFPTVHGYYVGFGIADFEQGAVTDIIELVLSGPVTATVDERLELA